MAEEEQQSYHPQISANSLKILEQKAQRDSIDQSRDSQWQRKPIEVYEPSFKPSINASSKEIKRKAPIDVLLVADAERREKQLRD